MRAELLSVLGVAPNILENYQTSVSDGAWHQVTLQRDGSNTTLKVDNIIAEKVICHDQEIRPGGSNISGDQNVYVGGLPSWYSTKLKVGSVIVLQGRRRFTLLSPSR